MPPPTITNVVITQSGTAIEVSWTTSVPCNSLLKWGPTDPVGNGLETDLLHTVGDTSFLTSHALSTGFIPSGMQAMSFQIAATDASGLQTVSELFVTRSWTVVPIVMPQIINFFLVQSVFTIQASWQTTVPCDTTLLWGPTDPRGVGTPLDLFNTIYDPFQVITHVEVTPVLAGGPNTYSFKVLATDASNSTVSNAVKTLKIVIPAPQVTKVTDLVVESIPKVFGKMRMVINFTAHSNVTGGPPIRTWTAFATWGTSPLALTNISPVYLAFSPSTQPFADFVGVDFGFDSLQADKIFYKLTIFDGAVAVSTLELFVDMSSQNPSLVRLYSREDGVEAVWDKVSNPPSYLLKHAPSLQAPSQQRLIMPEQPLFCVETQNSPEDNGLFRIVAKDGYVTIPGLIENNPFRFYLRGVQHVAFGWDGQFIELFINGVSAVKTASTFGFQASSPVQPPFPLPALPPTPQITEIRVGADFSNHYSEAFLSTLRISNVKRNPTELNFDPLNPSPFQFVVPTANMVTDANTIALYLLNGTLADSSGNGNTATSVGVVSYGGPPLGLNGKTTPVVGKFRTPSTTGYINLPTSVLTDQLNGTPFLKEGTIDFWVLWEPDLSDPLTAPVTSRIRGLRWEEPRYVQVTGTYQEQSFQTDVSPQGLLAGMPTTNGQVEALLVVGSLLYVGGSFTQITDTTGTYPRDNFAVIDMTTLLLTPITVSFDNTIRALTTDSSYLYAVGDFQLVDLVACTLAVKLDLSTLTVQPWLPIFTGTQADAVVIAPDGAIFICGADLGTTNGFPKGNVVAIAPDTATLLQARTPVLVGVTQALGMKLYFTPATGVTPEFYTLYIVGNFTTVTPYGGSPTARSMGAAIDALSGALFAWNPLCDNTIWDVEVIGTKAFVGGAFTTLSGTTHINFGAVDAVTGAPFSNLLNFISSIFRMKSFNGLLYCAGNFTSQSSAIFTNIAYLVAVNPVTVRQITTFNKLIVGAAVKDVAFYNGFVIMGGDFVTVTGQPFVDLAAAYISGVLQNFLIPIQNPPSFVAWMSTRVPDQLQIFQKSEAPEGIFSWRKARPLLEDTFNIQWSPDETFTSPFTPPTVETPRTVQVNVGGLTNVTIEQFVVQGQSSQFLAPIRREESTWNYRGWSSFEGIPTSLPVFPPYTGPYSTLQERATRLNGVLSFVIPDEFVASTLLVTSADRLTTFALTSDYSLLGNEITRITTGIIADGEEVLVSYQKDSVLTVQQNYRMAIREFLNSLLNPNFYDTESRTTNVFKLFDVYGQGFGDVQEEVNGLLQDRYISDGVLGDLPPKVSGSLSLGQPSGAFSNTWFQQAAQGQMGATRLGGTFQGTRTSARAVTGQACDITATNIGFHIIGDTENPSATAGDPDYYVGQSEVIIVDLVQDPFGPQGIDLLAVIPPIDSAQLAPGRQQILILGDAEGIAWELLIYDGAYDFLANTSSTGEGLVPGEVVFTLEGTPLLSNVFSIDLGVLGQHTTAGLDTPLADIITNTGATGIGATLQYSAVPSLASNTPALVGEEIAQLIATAINTLAPVPPSLAPLYPTVLSLFYTATLEQGSVPGVNNVLRITSNVASGFIGPATNDFSAQILPFHPNVLVSTTAPLDSTGTYYKFTGGSISKTVLGIPDLVPGSISLIDNAGNTIPAISYRIDYVEGSIAFIDPYTPPGGNFSVVGKAYMGNGGADRGVVVHAVNAVLPAYAPTSYAIQVSNPVDEPSEWGTGGWGQTAFGGYYHLR